MLNVLCVDSSTEACSVAVLCQNEKQQIVTDQFIFAPREHTAKILPMVQAVLQQACLKLADIDVVAYGRGPGSFTGVRIGISIAQGLAFGIDKPMTGISTLQAMAQQAYKTSKKEEQISDVYGAIDARMGEVYFAHYQLHNQLMVLVDQEVVIKPDELLTLALNVVENSVLVGSGWAAYPQLTEYFNVAKQLEIEFPSAKYMLDQAVNCVEHSLTVLPEFATPVYLRDKVTWKKLPGRE